MSQNGRPSVAARMLTGCVRGYQLIVSPWFAPTCRYYPSCSAYAITALRTHGAVKGTGLALWRVLRCNPWSRGGVDHVPPRPSTDGSSSTDAQANNSEPESPGGPQGRTLGSRTSRERHRARPAK
ncbi:MAG: membrane protein insertion efficiency factor YidD [Beutenbergiaceae bacterium]